MAEWERVEKVADDVAPAGDGRGQWDTTRKQNETLDQARDYLKQYAKRLKADDGGVPQQTPDETQD